MFLQPAGLSNQGTRAGHEEGNKEKGAEILWQTPKPPKEREDSQISKRDEKTPDWGKKQN